MTPDRIIAVSSLGITLLTGALPALLVPKNQFAKLSSIFRLGNDSNMNPAVRAIVHYEFLQQLATLEATRLTRNLRARTLIFASFNVGLLISFLLFSFVVKSDLGVIVIAILAAANTVALIFVAGSSIRSFTRNFYATFEAIEKAFNSPKNVLIVNNMTSSIERVFHNRNSASEYINSLDPDVEYQVRNCTIVDIERELLMPTPRIYTLTNGLIPSGVSWIKNFANNRGVRQSSSKGDITSQDGLPSTD